jgi:serine/threonine protein kinase
MTAPDVSERETSNGTDQSALLAELEAKRKQVESQERELKALRDEVHEMKYEKQRIQARQALDMKDAVEFVRSLGASAEPALEKRINIDCMKILGMGHYGFVFTSAKRDNPSSEVVVKLQSLRWAEAVMKEWGHGSALDEHPNIVQYQEVLLHRDKDRKIQKHLENGFDNGVLKGKRPKIFPEVYLSMSIEYMDRGTVQDLMDQGVFTLEGVGAVTRAIASALAYVHLHKSTHNDIKMENILVATSSDRTHLIPKLADFGLADHSAARERDYQLFGYTVWCMGLGRSFSKVPTDDMREDALVEFRRDVDSAYDDDDLSEAVDSKTLGRTLAKVIDGIWKENLAMDEVRDMEELRGLIVKPPPEGEKTEALRASARRSVLMRGITTEAILQKCAPAGTVELTDSMRKKRGTMKLEVPGI